MRTPPVMEHGDPGLQPERTSLAWSRTIIAYAAVALLTVRIIDRLGPIALVALAVTGVTCLTIVLGQPLRYRAAVRSIGAESGSAAVRSVIATASATATVGVLAALAVVIG